MDEEYGRENVTAKHDIIVLGSGNSTSVPLLSCIAKENPTCPVCLRALEGDPKKNKYNRLNPSIIIRTTFETGERRHLLIDAGKTFREAAVRWFPDYNIEHVDGVLFTHDHADAMLGIDDLRMAQKKATTLPLYMSEETYAKVKNAFKYLINVEPEYMLGIKKRVQTTLTRKPKTFVASVQCKIVATPEVKDDKLPHPFDFEGILCQPFPVYHGGRDILSMGFVFGSGKRKLVYISDLNDLPKAGLEMLRSLDIELMIIDGNHPTDNHRSHLSIKTGLQIAKRLKVRHVKFIGMAHEVDHEKVSKDLAKNAIDAELLYDGMLISLDNIDI